MRRILAVYLEREKLTKKNYVGKNVSLPLLPKTDHLQQVRGRGLPLQNEKRWHNVYGGSMVPRNGQTKYKL